MSFSVATFAASHVASQTVTDINDWFNLSLIKFMGALNGHSLWQPPRNGRGNLANRKRLRSLHFRIRTRARGARVNGGVLCLRHHISLQRQLL